MPVSDKIVVHGEYTRAVNIERDTEVGGYILTDNSLSLLQRVASNLEQKIASRSWLLIGPHGTGKSAFALYLSALLGDKNWRETGRARAVCKKRDAGLSAKLRAVCARGFCPVVITGAREALAPRLISQLTTALKKHFPDGDFAELVAENPPPQVSAIVDFLYRANRAVVNAGGAGIFLIVDEMGKFLEYDGDNPSSDNAYLFQALSGLTVARGKDDGNFLFLGVMHIGGEHYLRRQGRDAMIEWRKVEGRFEKFPFQESPDHLLRLLARTFECDLDGDGKRKVNAALESPVRVILESGIFNFRAPENAAKELLANCYPLHPATALLLVALSEKIGQNERTMFSYVSSPQPHGFKDAAGELQAAGEWILPWQLYDYFLAGGLSMSVDFSLSRILAEVESAMNRLGAGAPESHVRMLKTIALFNLAGVRGSFSASPELLGEVSGDARAAKKTLKFLVDRSLVVYRKFGNEYRIWQGSDFNLDEEVDKRIKRMTAFCLAGALNNKNALSPIVAHKHSIKTGNFRRLPAHFITEKTWQEGEKNAVVSRKAAPRLIVFMREGERDHAVFNEVRKKCEQNDIVVCGRGGEKLENILRQSRALEEVRNSSKELHSDPVAAREIKTRIAQVARSEQRLIDASVGRGVDVYWRGKAYKVNNRRDMQNAVSAAMDDVYPAAPRIVNELLNRDKPSAQATGARLKLLLAIKHSEGKKDLGIEKHPPEKGMYLSVLHRSGLHRRVGKSWQLCPPKKNDEWNYNPVWNFLTNFFEDSKDAPRSFTDLNSVLQSPPFGIKSGVLPFLYGVFILANKDMLVYEDGKYAPFFGDEHLERFVARPETFKFQKSPSGAQNEDVFNMYRKVGGNDIRRGGLLDISRPLVKLVQGLPEYAKNSEKVGAPARAFCRAVVNADSPHNMLLRDIPRALEFCETDMLVQSGRDKCAAALRDVVMELNKAYDGLLHHFAVLIAQDLQVEYCSFEKLQRDLAGRVDGLERYSIDREGLLAFFRCVAEDSDDGKIWLKRILLFLADKSPDKWSDSDANRAEYKLAEYMRRMADLESLRAFERSECEGGSSALVRVISARGEQEKRVRLDKSPSLNSARAEIQNILSAQSASARLHLAVSVLEAILWEESDQKNERVSKKIIG